MVVGGGAIAEGKVAPLVAAGARVTVIAPALGTGLAAQHRAGRFAHVARDYEPGDLAGAFLVIGATDNADVNHAVHAEATAIGALINVVDDVPYCQFILPSILRRGDLTVAVSSAGHAPALAVRVRERLERELGDEYGRFLELAAELRVPLAQSVPDFPQRKAIWYRLVDSDVLALLRAGQEARARTRIADITGISLERLKYEERKDTKAPSATGAPQVHPQGSFIDGGVGSAEPRSGTGPFVSFLSSWLTSPGTVYLVGAGPGDPKLITVRGLDLLRRADVVVYDRLVSPALLEEVPPDAELVYVGKAPGGHCMPQEGINALLVHEARLGKTVVRLKGATRSCSAGGRKRPLRAPRPAYPWRWCPAYRACSEPPHPPAFPSRRAGTPAASR